MRLPYFLGLTLGLLGCSAPGLDVDDDTELLVPDNVSIHWDSGFNELEDGLGSLIPIDVMVYEGETGEPIDGVSITLSSHHRGIGLLRLDDVIPLEPEQAFEGESYWDFERDQHFAIGLETDLLPANRLSFETDMSGLVPLYIFVDGFIVEDGVQLSAPVTVTMAYRDETFVIGSR